MHIIIWEFRVPEAQQPAFERAYGRSGYWADLFANGEGFVGTALLRDRTDLPRYRTIDR